MSKFMNAELEAIRDNLECGHCACRFKGSDSQAWKVKYEKKVVYCSLVCRHAAVSQKARERALREGKIPKEGVLAGPCKTCGKMFQSRTSKQFCSMGCYTKSDQFKAMLAENRAKLSPETRESIAVQLKKGCNVPCLECGVEFYQKRPTKNVSARKFCGRGCYRSYLAKRFDRWIANPEGMALPQCYDEFLDKEELACVVDGCNWHGQHLTTHMNMAHGVQAEEFKRAAGFNLSTGVIARPLAQVLRQRESVGVALNQDGAALELARAKLSAEHGIIVQYRSLEAIEHAKKSRAMWGPGPQRHCKGCGSAFQQSTPSGLALYCSTGCRDNHYAIQRHERAKRRVRRKNGTFTWVA